MTQTVRRIFATLAALGIILVLIASVAWWSIHTSWFANLVRSRIVSTLESASGGSVVLQSFSFDPDTLNTRVSGLVVRGTEPAGSKPLLSVRSTDLRLKILSVWRQDVDLEAIIFSQPEIHIILNPDGSTNVPKPKHRNENTFPVERLLDLKVKRLEVVRGLLVVNSHRARFSFISQGVGMLLTYNRKGPSYGLALKSEKTNISAGKASFEPMQISVAGRVFQDYADIDSFNLTTGSNSSSIQLSGKIRHFAQPVADANLDANLSIDELARLGGISDQLRNGRGGAVGTLHYEAASNRFIFKGKASAHSVDFVSPVFTLHNMGGKADMIANNDGMLLHHAEAAARGANFSGEGSIRAYRYLKVEGQVAQVDIQEVGKYLTNEPFPWSGSAHGPAHASANLGDMEPDFIIGGNLQIDEGKTGIPTGGSVEVTYYDRNTKIEFGNSTLSLPHTKASFQGALGTDLSLNAQTTNLADLQPLLPILGARLSAASMPAISSDGSVHFDGVLHDLIHRPEVRGRLEVDGFKFRGYDWDSLTAQLSFSATELSVPQFSLHQAGASLTGSASAELAHWSVNTTTPLRVNAQFENLNLPKTVSLFTTTPAPVIHGIASGKLNFKGTLNAPQCDARFEIENLDAYGEQLNRVQFDAALDNNQLEILKGRVQSGTASLLFSGKYQHSPSDWATGDVSLRADTSGFPISSLSTARKYIPALDGLAELHVDTFGKLRSNSFEPLRINGSAEFQHIALNKRDLGNASLNAVTQGSSIMFRYSGDLRDTKFHGAAEAKLALGTPVRGNLQMDRINLAAIRAFASETKLAFPVDGFLDGDIAFDGLLEEPAHMHAQANIRDLQISSAPRTSVAPAVVVPDIVLRNKEPILIDIAGGILKFSKFQIEGRDTSVNITGEAPFLDSKPVDIKAVGKADLGLLMLFDPNVHSSGSSELAAHIAGSLAAPVVAGTLQVRNGTFFLADIPNGLSDVNGSVVFNRNRATIQKMTAHSGGGDISLGGSISFGEGSTLVYRLDAAARNVRVRYANSISVTANSDLRLSGTSANSLLSGNLTVTRVVFTPNADAGNLLAAASTPSSTPADKGDFISGLHLDVGIESTPSLQVSTNLSRDVEAEIQLRMRGTPDHPILLGTITANQGDIKIFGTRFSLNRGEVSFVNSVRIEPVLDLDLETQARGVTVDITVSGAPSKLNFNYRSDPPMQPRDIIALLTVGHAPGVGSTSNAQGGSDVTALTSGVNTVLGQAISPVSNRLSKLFGITNIKIDPFVQGITNTPQARLSVEQQISRDVSVTYVTNLSQTSEQIFRFEWALSRQFSVVAIRDDNGEFGIDFQYKKRFK